MPRPPMTSLVLAWGVAMAGVAGTLSPASAQNGNLKPNEMENLFSPEGFHDPQQSKTQVKLPWNVDVGSVRKTLENVSSEAHALYRSLWTQEAQIAGVRRLSADLLRLEVRAKSLANRLNNREDLESNLGELQQIDADWRQLSYNLKLLSGLDQQTKSLIDRIDQASGRFAGLLNIGQGQSIDYRQLVAQTGGLAAAMDRLIQDLGFVLNGSPESRQLIANGQSVKQQATHVADGAFQQFNRDHLVTDFEIFQTSWSKYMDALRKLRDPLIDHDVQNVNAFERKVTSQLRMEHKLDRSQLIFLADQLSRDVDSFFAQAPLKMLIRLPLRDRALSTADAFYGNFENFVDVVKRGSNRDDLRYTFDFIDDAWENFNHVFGPLPKPEAQQALSEIQSDVDALREALLIQDGGDLRHAAELASQVATLAMYIRRDAERWLGKAQVSGAYQIRRDIARYHQHATDLHESIVAGADRNEISALCDVTFSDWRQVYNGIIQCHTSERASLAMSSQKTTPALVSLQAIFRQQ